MDKTAIKPDRSDNAWVQTQRRAQHCYGAKLNDLGTANVNIQLYGAGSACGTLADFRRFGQALLPGEDGSSPLFASPGTLALMYAPTLYYPDSEKAENCHGFWLDERDLVWHNGGTPGSSSLLKLDVKNGVGVVVVVNKAAVEADYNAVSEMVFGGAYTGSQGEPMAPEIFAGIYSPSRKVGVGGLKVYDFINVIVIGEEFGTINEVEPGVYRAAGNGIIMRSVTFGEDGKAQKFSVTSMELNRMSTPQYIAQAAVLILFALAAVYGAVTLVLLLCKALRKKPLPMLKTRLAVCASIVVAGVCFAHFASAAVTYNLAYENFVVRGTLFALSAIPPLVYAVLLALRWESLNCRRLGLVLNALTGLVAAGNILYWQLWII